MPAGSFSNAALVGAKTVNGPLPDSVSRAAAFTAATSVLKFSLFTAFQQLFCHRCHSQLVQHEFRRERSYCQSKTESSVRHEFFLLREEAGLTAV